MEKKFKHQTKLQTFKLKGLRSLNAISLPSIKHLSREKVDTLLQTDREKVKEKIKKNYYAHDISYLRNKQSFDLHSETLSHYLYTDITDIYNNVYKTQEQNLNFWPLKSIQKPKSPSNFIEKILSPSKSQPELSKTLQISAPSGRQEVINLKTWLDLIEKKYFSNFKDLLSAKASIDGSKVLKA